MTLQLRSIEEEAAACRAAWAAVPDATHGAHIHHEVACEALTEPIENRIAYVLREKPVFERALRLRLMRPTTAPARKAYDEAVAPASKAYNEAVATASKAYSEAVATARKAYSEAVATARKAYSEAVAPASKAYNEAVAPARKAYDEAVATASKAYNEAVARAHRLVCAVDGCPFDGRTIFPEGGV